LKQKPKVFVDSIMSKLL